MVKSRTTLNKTTHTRLQSDQVTQPLMVITMIKTFNQVIGPMDVAMANGMLTPTIAVVKITKAM